MTKIMGSRDVIMLSFSYYIKKIHKKDIMQMMNSFVIMQY